MRKRRVSFRSFVFVLCAGFVFAMLTFLLGGIRAAALVVVQMLLGAGTNPASKTTKATMPCGTPATKRKKMPDVER